MIINKVVIACFKHDLFLLRPCVASIHYWHPNAEIFLLKDHIQGNFCTREIEERWGVKIFPATRRNFGWPWSKLAVALADSKARYLFLDSDIVLLGPILDELSKFNEDFIVTGIKDGDKTSHNVNTHYIDMAAMAKFDPGYEYPGFAFNGGQIVMTSGLLKEKDFASAIEIGDSIVNKRPDMFKHGDQGALNYVFAKACQAGKITLRYSDFWIWPGTPAASQIDLQAIKEKRGIPYVLHWAGIKPVDFRNYVRSDLLDFYNDFYYSKIPMGGIKRKLRFFSKLCSVKLKIIKYTLLRRKYT